MSHLQSSETTLTNPVSSLLIAIGIIAVIKHQSVSYAVHPP